MRNQQTNLQIIKANGEKEAFNVDKLLRSLLNAGVEREIAQKVTEEIGRWVYDGATSREIYHRTFTLMR